MRATMFASYVQRQLSKTTPLLRLLFMGLFASAIPKSLFCQDSTVSNKIITFPDKFFAALDKKSSLFETSLDKKTDQYLEKFQKQEHKLRKKLWRKDSTLAKQLFDDVDAKYNQLKNVAVGKTTSAYSGHLDSIVTALNFLKTNDRTNPAFQKSLDQYKELQSKLDASEQIKNYVIQRRELLKQQFEKLGMVKQLKVFRKDVYYYQEQVREYREMFEDPNKMEVKLMLLAVHIPQFKDFFIKNSMLGSMFALAGGSGSTSLASLQGLQTRALISQTIVDRLGSGVNVDQLLQQNVRSAQDQLGQLKDKLSSYSNGSYGNTKDDNIPHFKPNNEKSKSIWQRLEYGGNIQSQKARYFFPVTSDIALSLGYKINNKSSIGIGAAYKLGWGSNWNNIKLSHQGVGLRSYLDWKIKGSFYFSGGYEQNYKSMINSIDQLKNYSAWQTSGLIGVNKKYSISKKMKGEMKLLWDFMSYQQIPRAQPILFRIGYSLK